MKIFKALLIMTLIPNILQASVARVLARSLRTAQNHIRSPQRFTPALAAAYLPKAAPSKASICNQSCTLPSHNPSQTPRKKPLPKNNQRKPFTYSKHIKGLTGVFLASGLAIHFATDKKNTAVKYKKRILENAQEVHDQNNKIRILAKIAITTLWEKDPGLACFLYKKMVSGYETICPFFLLEECTSGFCGLSREYSPALRTTYEDETSAALITSIDADKEKTAHYTSFASGGLFQDFVILTKTLAARPEAHVVIHIIDHEYTPYAKTCDLLRNKREVSPCNDLNAEPIMQQLVIHARANWQAEEMPDSEIINDLKREHLVYDLRFKQLLLSLQTMFAQSKLSLHVHESTESYLDFIKNNELPHSDVITTADIGEAGPQAYEHYRELCSATLTHKPPAQGIFLCTNGIRREPSIEKTCSKECPNSYIINLENPKYKPFYMTSMPLSQ